ncbi:TatD family hydrolase [bacterium]|nr:TatD family hydrolase [bacterium]
MIRLYDTHAHLADAAFEHDLETVLETARQKGVEAVVAVAEDLDDSRRNLVLAGSFSMVRPAAGLYPAILDLAQAEDMLSFIRQNRTTLVAIAEVGLDFWLAKTEQEQAQQIEILTAFIDLAIELDLPLNVHSRSAGAATIDLLMRRNARKVQLHAFDGKASKAAAGVEAGFFFSVPPSIVRSRQKQKLVRSLPLECLLLETDSPVLGPVPNQRNEPALITVALETLAEIKALPMIELARIIARNTERLYGPSLLNGPSHS